MGRGDTRSSLLCLFQEHLLHVVTPPLRQGSWLASCTWLLGSTLPGLRFTSWPLLRGSYMGPPSPRMRNESPGLAALPTHDLPGPTAMAQMSSVPNCFQISLSILSLLKYRLLPNVDYVLRTPHVDSRYHDTPPRPPTKASPLPFQGARSA